MFQKMDTIVLNTPFSDHLYLFLLVYDETTFISHTNQLRNSANIIVTSFLALRRPRARWDPNILYIRNLPFL